MNTTRKTPKGKDPANSIRRIATPAAPSIPAPAGWRQQTAFGFMRFDDSPAGRLVRLADVLRELESSRELPRAAALDMLCDGMPANVLQWCYQLHHTDYAQPLPSDCMFGFRTAAQIDAAKAKRENEARHAAMRTGWVTSWEGAPSFRPALRVAMVQALVAPAEPATPGLPALLKLLRLRWAHVKLRRDSTCDALDDPKAALPNSLAIRLDKAVELWRYGQAVQFAVTDAQPSNWAELVDEYKAHAGKSWKWTSERLALVTREKTLRSQRGDSGVMQVLAAELGVKRQTLTGALRAKSLRDQAASPVRIVRKL